MIKLRSSLFDWVRHRRELRRWSRAAREAPRMRFSLLRAERARARKLMYSLNEVVSVADNRLALPMIGSVLAKRPQLADAYLAIM